MLFILLLMNIINADSKEVSKPYVVLPVPLGLPFRNERAEQCWLRIEDVELLETVAVYCYVAQSFLRNHIYDYNSRKMLEDDVDVSLWSEEPRNQEEIALKPTSQKSSVIDWKITTILDPITRMRLYVSRQADCKLIMYSREAETSYKVDCDKVLFFVNDRMTNNAQLHDGRTKLSAIMLIAITLLVL
ncbi:unnamed protein product [Leptosia nina]|uniref:Uncharacterized protein n=1 Tax=Leptosia nina TaxID=320188 RepID=A0AAV1J8A0_9NEOP